MADKDEAKGGESADSELKARLDRLSAALRDDKAGAEASRAGAAAGEAAQATGRALGLGFRVASELLAGVLVGGGIGWALDRWLGTSPLILIPMLILGMAAGFWNVYKLARGPARKG